ncbi:AraC family transcriptional regulator [Parabacteroides distasonis]|nr:AraC family transcriptional regulator [Parabacteroides distasonis]
MEETFKRIPPEDVFITVFKRKPTEEELWMGVPPDFDGNRPSGNNLIDLFAYLIRKYGRMDTSEYARIMQLKTSELRGAILAIGGMSAMEWRNRYLLLEAQELMERTDMSITAIAAKLGFSQPSVFSKFFRTLTKSQPWEWRVEKKKTGLKPEENLSLLRVISRQYMLKHTPSVQFPPQSSLL